RRKIADSLSTAAILLDSREKTGLLAEGHEEHVVADTERREFTITCELLGRRTTVQPREPDAGHTVAAFRAEDDFLLVGRDVIGSACGIVFGDWHARKQPIHLS